MMDMDELICVDLNMAAYPIDESGVIGLSDPGQDLDLMTAGLKATANAVVITNRDGVVVWANDAFTHLTGYEVEEALDKKPGDLLKSGIHDPKFYRSFWETILAGRVWSGELFNRRKDGSLYFEEMTVTPFRAFGKDITHFIAIIQDITQRKKTEEQYRQRTAELEALAHVSNALRNARRKTEIGPIILDQLLEIMDVHAAILVLLDLATGDTVIEHANGDWAAITGQRIPAGIGISAAVIASGQPYITGNIQTDETLAVWDAPLEPYAAAGVPLFSQNTAIGALWIGRKIDSFHPEKLFASNEIRLLTAIGDVAANTLHRIMLHEETERRTYQLAALHTIDEAINSSLDAKLALRVVVDQVIDQLKVDAASVLILDEGTLFLKQVASRGFRRNLITQPSLPVYSSFAGKAILERKLVFVPNLADTGALAQVSRLSDPGMADEGFVTLLVAPLIAKGQVKGGLQLFHRSQLNPSVEWFEFLDAIAHQTAVAVDNIALFENLQRKNDQLIQAYDILLESWVRSLQLRDHETELHTRRVTEMTLRLARAVGMTDEELVHVRRGALLHDIGKIAIPDAILLKPGTLSADEWAIMRRHPTYAYELLSPIPYLRQAMDIPLYHHEKWDGSGYPSGLKAEYIPLAARLFAPVDVWDAMRSERPYRPAIPREEVLAYIQGQAGIHFDPKIVPIFIEGCRAIDAD